MLRRFVLALGAWARAHLLRSKDERYGDLIVFDDVLVYLPNDDAAPAPHPPPRHDGGRRRGGRRRAA